jgi:hypothetical protein
MAIKHVTANAYKAGIDEKTKKLKDTSITTEQRKVIQQDLEKLKETQQKNFEVLTRHYDCQLSCKLGH